MRADMGKVLVERPRLGGIRHARKGYRKRAAKGLAAGDAPAREGMKARSGGTKHFNEHLAPLRRFLDANVGRPWDKVYSEISAHIDRGNVVQKHVLTHLFEYVVTRTVERDGEPFDATPRQWYLGRPVASLRTSHSRYAWYVCPRSGLLRKSRYVPWDWKPKPEKLPRRVRVSPTEVCLELADGWELITLKPLPDPVPDRRRFDVVRNRPVGAVADHEARQLFGVDAYAAARRRLSRAEQKRLPIPIDWVK